MKIIEGKEREYMDWREKNTDPYGRRCFTYAEDWADLMEEEIARRKAVSQAEVYETIQACAKPLSHEADTDGITGFMYGMAVSILSGSWVHGDLLRRWHNLATQIGTEGEEANRNGGTLNPALLVIRERKK